MSAVRRRYELTDEEWNRISKYFEPEVEIEVGRPKNDVRTTVNGIIWIAKSGAPWRDLPERYGKWNTVYKSFAAWEKTGTYAKIFSELSINADMQDLSLDSTSCKAHQHSAGAKKGL